MLLSLIVVTVAKILREKCLKFVSDKYGDWWCFPTPSEGWGMEGLHGEPTVGPHTPRCKYQRWKIKK